MDFLNVVDNSLKVVITKSSRETLAQQRTFLEVSQEHMEGISCVAGHYSPPRQCSRGADDTCTITVCAVITLAMIAPDRGRISFSQQQDSECWVNEICAQQKLPLIGREMGGTHAIAG